MLHAYLFGLFVSAYDRFKRYISFRIRMARATGTGFQEGYYWTFPNKRWDD